MHAGLPPVHFFDWLDELEPTWYTAVPSMHAGVLLRARGRSESVSRHRLRFVRSSSAALPATVHQELESVFDVPVVEAYGMTEAAHQMASNPLPPAVRKPGTVGKAAGPEVAVLDPSGRELSAGEIGEVAIRGESVFAGYEMSSDAKPFTEGGWFRTGDEGFLDEEGYLTLRGRIKEIINRGGEKISPLEVDDALLGHQGVAQAVTFAMSDLQLGEEVAAAVVLAPDVQLDERGLQDFVAAQLAPFKVPRRILVLDELPTGATGKLQRIGLAERLGLENGASSDAGRRPYRFLEPQLIEIWESVLDTRGLDVGSDFFALGGDSILGAEAVARVRDLVGDPDLPLISIVRCADARRDGERGRLLRRAWQLRRGPAPEGRDTHAALPRPPRRRRAPDLSGPNDEARHGSAELRTARERHRRRWRDDAVVPAGDRRRLRLGGAADPAARAVSSRRILRRRRDRARDGVAAPGCGRRDRADRPPRPALRPPAGSTWRSLASHPRGP